MIETHDHQQLDVKLADAETMFAEVSEWMDSLSSGILLDPTPPDRRTDTYQVKTGERHVSTQCILVVDDHEPLLKASQGILEDEGYTVFTATDGAQALQVMEEASPNLIVADIMMPRMDGYDLCRAIRAQAEWVSIPFIFLTARTEREDRLRGKEMGVEDYLTKPFDPQELLVTVRSRLQRAQDIQEAEVAKFEQLKRQIVTVLGHELRTPLTYVLGYTDLALEEVPSLSAADLGELLLGIKQGADRLNRLVEDLMLLIQLDTGQAAGQIRLLVRECHDMEAVLKAATAPYEKQVAAQGIVLELEVEPDLPPTHLCEYYLRDAVGRLIDNAVKFSPGEGRRVTVSARSTVGWLEISVADEGIGIEADALPLIFDRFVQINRDKMEQRGTGLGLAIARELVQLHDGKITVESTLGQGSTFKVHLPVAAG